MTARRRGLAFPAYPSVLLVVLAACADDPAAPSAPAREAPGGRAPAIGAQLEDSSLATAGLDGAPLSWLDPGTRGSLLLFVGVDCPISNRYAPAIARLAERLGEIEIPLFLVYTDSSFDRTAVERHVEEYSLPGTVLLDHQLQLRRATGVEVTPEAALIDSSGHLVYRGRIDDRYIDFGVYRQEARTEDLRRAVEALVAGKRIEVPEARAIGCYIHDPGSDAEPRGDAS